MLEYCYNTPEVPPSFPTPLTWLPISLFNAGSCGFRGGLESSMESRSEGVVGEKRRAAEDGRRLMEGKRTKRGTERGLFGGVRKVAEMVLVLAAMGKIRGGMGPSGVEREMMDEARNCLVEVCQGFAPKDVFPRDAFGGLIEELGLDKLKDQRTGLQPPKLSIAHKLLISKRKMEKAENFPVPSTQHPSQRLQGNPGATFESHSALHHVHMSQQDKLTHMPVTSGTSQSPSPLGRGSTINSSSLPYQLPTSEIRPVVSSALPSSHLVSGALPRADVPNLRSNGSSHASQVQANYSVNSYMKTPSWSMQPQSVSSVKIGSSNKVPVNMSFKVEGTADVKPGFAPQVMSKGVNAQIATGPPLRGTNHVQASLGNTHAEIGKVVQKILQPRISEHRPWIPPSRDYMNKALTCQMCTSTITDVDSILICDACEKGYHLKCLQTTNQKGVPRGEWHCAKCLSLSNGKPVPPKYGRVLRNMTMSNFSSTFTAVPATLNKEVGTADEKLSQLNRTVNGNTSLQNDPTVGAKNNCSHQVSGSKTEDANGIQENDVSLSKAQNDDKVYSGKCSNNMINIPNSGCVSSVDSPFEKPINEKTIELKPGLLSKLEMVPDSSNRPLIMQCSQDNNLQMPNGDGDTLRKSIQNPVMISDLKESHGNEKSSHDSTVLNERVVQDNPLELACNSELMKQGRSSSSDSFHAVNWVGDPAQVFDGKIYYASCSINGHVYKVKDHAIIRFASDKLIPSKLQAMWEDMHTTLKWVTVNRCYFPGDLPEDVGRPCSLESNEVFESTSCTTLMACLIESPCEILPPRKFAEESEKRSRSPSQPTDCSPPIYLCNWIFDESEKLFRDTSS